MKTSFIFLILIMFQFCGSDPSSSVTQDVSFKKKGFFPFQTSSRIQGDFRELKEEDKTHITLNLIPLDNNQLEEKSLKIKYSLTLRFKEEEGDLWIFGGKKNRKVQIATYTKDPNKLLKKYWGPIMKANLREFQIEKSRLDRQISLSSSSFKKHKKQIFYQRELAEKKRKLTRRIERTLKYLDKMQTDGTFQEAHRQVYEAREERLSQKDYLEIKKFFKELVRYHLPQHHIILNKS